MDPTNSTTAMSIDQMITTAVPILEYTTRLTVGVVLSIAGNMLISVAMNVQKYSHNQLIDTGKSYLRSYTWWAGLVLMIFGEMGNFTAYGFAPASLVAPLGSTAVIVNAIIAVIFLKEEIRPKNILGITWAIIGAYLLVTFSNKRDTMLSGDEIVDCIKNYPFLIYMLLEIITFLLIIYLHRQQNQIRVVTVLLQVAVLGSCTVISAKAVSSMLSLTFYGHNQLFHPVFYFMLIVMVASAIGQVKFLNQAMAAFDTTVVMPTNFVFFTVSAILSGIAFYQEYYGLTYIQVIMSLFGILLSFGGVYFITGAAGEESQSNDSEMMGLLTSQSLSDSLEATERRVQFLDDATNQNPATEVNSDK